MNPIHLGNQYYLANLFYQFHGLRPENLVPFLYLEDVIAHSKNILYIVEV